MAELKQKEYQLVIFALGNEELGIDISGVRGIIRLMSITKVPKAPDFIEGVINLRGKVIAVIDLAKRLGMPMTKRTDRSRIVIIEFGGSEVGVIVDSVSEVLRLPLESIDNVSSVRNMGISENYLLGVGKWKDRMLIILDCDRIFTPEELHQVENHLTTAHKQEDKKEEGARYED